MDEISKKNLKKAASIGLIGGVALGIGRLVSTPSEPSIKNINRQSTIAQSKPLPKDTEELLGVETLLRRHFLGEYDTIKKAADRNNCRGEDLIILFAIRKAENGGPGNEFGIMNSKARNTNLDTQAGWCASTIVRNRGRWDGKGDFIEFLGGRYAPVGVKNDPRGLNKNWVKNVKFWYRKLSA